jgi:signal transduction histidine kinase
MVTDTGIGIDESDIPHMFKLYGKLEDSENMNHKGVGLGLYITK